MKFSSELHMPWIMSPTGHAAAIGTIIRFVSKPLITDNTVSMALLSGLGISVGCDGINTALLT
jgi:hypothetical protein